MDAELRDGTAQDLATAGVDLAGHEARRHLQDVRRHAEVVHRLRGLEAEETAAEDRRRARARRPGADRVEILDRAVDEDAGERGARHRRHERRRAGRENEDVVVDAATADGLDGARGAIDRDDAITEVESDVAFRIPHDVRELQILGSAAVEERAQVDAIVGGARLLREDDHVPTGVAVELDESLAQTMRDHAVADDHQFRGCHVAVRHLACFSLRSREAIDDVSRSLER